MNYLIGDIGNTSLKICKINNKFRIVKTFFFRTRSVYLEKDLKKKINQFTKNNICNKILFSSVVPNVYRKIDKIFSYKILTIYAAPTNVSFVHSSFRKRTRGQKQKINKRSCTR